VTASLLEQLADLPKAEVDALIRAMAPGEANAFEYHLALSRPTRTTAARRILAAMAADGWARLSQEPLRRRMGAGGAFRALIRSTRRDVGEQPVQSRPIDRRA